MKQLLFLIFLFLTSLASSQTIKLRGFVKDSIGEPLELANVIAMVKATGVIESYAITNFEGRYQLDLPIKNTYILRASFLGFETQEKEVVVPETPNDLTLFFNLNPQANQLEGVEIVYEMPVTVKGDTIVYNADSFNRGDERKLGDVMKNLPGVKVNDEGEIEVEGKAVTKVMVEGKDFFDGDSKLATKNIPANAVDKVEVLRNYSEVGQLRGVTNNQDNVAINIKLKEGKKNFWFGEITAGSGLDAKAEGRYLAHPKLFYYSPKYSLNFITDFNDIGEVPFTWRDYFNFTGGFRNFNRGGGTNLTIRESDLGFAVAQNNRANSIVTKFLAANFSYATSKSFDVSGFGILSSNKTNIVTNSLTQYISSGVTESTEGNSNQYNQLGMLKLSGVYKPNINLQVDYDALVKASKQTEEDASRSLFQDFSNAISETKENKPASINQNLNLYYTLNENDIFAGQLQHLLQEEDPFYNAVTDLLPFAGVLPVDTLQNKFDINQEKNIKTHKLDGKIDYYHIINSKSNINLSLGSTLSRQKFNSNIFQLLDNGNREDFLETAEIESETQTLVNDVAYGFSDFFIGLHYKLKKGQFTFSPGVTLHNYLVKNEQLGISVTQNDWRLLPDFFALWEIKKSESLRFNYSLSAEYTDVNNFAEAYVFNNYNRLFRGNRYLENSFSHNYSLNYFSFNLFNYTNISASVNYTRRLKGIKNNSQIVAINQVTSPLNIDSNFPDEAVTVFANFSKRVKKIELAANANVSLNISNNAINQTIQKSESFTQNYQLSARSSFREWPNFEIGYNLTLNNYKNGGLEQTFYTQQPFLNADINFLKYFTLSANWDLYNYTNKEGSINNEYSFLNGTLYFQKGDSPWELSLQATNLLNTTATNNDSFTDEFNTTSQYLVLPRILMLVVKYDL